MMTHQYSRQGQTVEEGSCHGFFSMTTMGFDPVSLSLRPARYPLGNVSFECKNTIWGKIRNCHLNKDHTLKDNSYCITPPQRTKKINDILPIRPPKSQKH
jgi:hypothetical protein